MVTVRGHQPTEGLLRLKDKLPLWTFNSLCWLWLRNSCLAWTSSAARWTTCNLQICPSTGVLNKTDILPLSLESQFDNLWGLRMPNPLPGAFLNKWILMSVKSLIYLLICSLINSDRATLLIQIDFEYGLKCPVLQTIPNTEPMKSVTSVKWHTFSTKYSIVHYTETKVKDILEKS